MPQSLFGSSERSNFIVNMKPETFRRWALFILLGFLILCPLLSLPSELAGITSLPPAALTLTGTAALAMLPAGLFKGARGLWNTALLTGAFVLWGIVSALCSFHAGDPADYTQAFVGTAGRGEGALSLVFCGCFLLLGAMLGTSEHRTLLHGMLLYGLVQCAWGILQALPVGFPSYYRDLESMLAYRVFLPSGLTGSPITLAVLLSVLELPAMLAAAYAKDRHRILYLICAGVFPVLAVRTQCLAGIVGAAVSVMIGIVYLAWKKTGKAVILTAVPGVVLGCVWWFFAPVLNGTYHDLDPSSAVMFQLYDGAVLWQDSSYRLDVSGYYFPTADASPHGTFAIGELRSVYGWLWGQTAEIIGRYPLTGTGPDCLIYPQLFRSLIPAENPNTFDRAGSYYLHTAATLGLPGLALLLSVMVQVFIRGGKTAVRGGWIQTAYLGAALVSCVTWIVGNGGVTVTPLFWMIAGVCCAQSKES